MCVSRNIIRHDCLQLSRFPLSVTELAKMTRVKMTHKSLRRLSRLELRQLSELERCPLCC